MNLLSNDNNKAILWNALYTNQIFSNIPNTMLNEVQIIFENNINQLEKSLSKQEIDNSQLIEYHHLQQLLRYQPP